MLGVAIATLQAWRRLGKPPGLHPARPCRTYRLSDLRELIRQGGYANRPGDGKDASFRGIPFSSANILAASAGKSLAR